MDEIKTEQPDEAINWKSLRERAKRLGLKAHKRGREYQLEYTDGGGFGGTSLNAINSWLDVIEFKLPVQISTACGMPLFSINEPKTETLDAAPDVPSTKSIAAKRPANGQEGW